MSKSKREKLTREQKKALKLERKEQRKNETPKQRWKRRGKKLLRVLLVIVAVIVAIVLLVVIAVNVSYAIKDDPAEPHAAAAERDAQVEELAASSDLPSYDALDDNGDELYVSQTGVGWEQTDPDYSEEQAERWAGSYDGVEPYQIMGAYCMNCHITEELSSYSASEEAARAEVESMVEKYGCTDLTSEQIDALVDLFTSE